MTNSTPALASWLRMKPLQYLVAFILSALILALAAFERVPFELTLLEAAGVVAYAWSVWLLARNNPLGWWIGLVGVSLYAVIFFQVQLYAEVGIQGVYFITSLQAIYLWLRGGRNNTERPVGMLSARWHFLTAALGLAGLIALHALLTAVHGAVPFWDALTTILSLVAHLYLMGRYVESWYLWIVVDLIYIPLYASRGLYVTSALYAVFLVMAVYGLITFQREYRAQRQPAALRAETAPSKA